MSDPKKWWVLFAVCLLTVLLNIDVMAVNLAIPKIAGEFHTKLVTAQWILNAFLLFAGVFTMLGGVFGARFGNKHTFLLGCILFVVSSIGAAIAWGIYPLIFFRALQGFSLGLSYPTSVVLATEAFPKEQRALPLGYIVGTMGISLGLGPIVGGLIIHALSWRWIFYVNIPTGLLTIILTIIFCKNRTEKKAKLDWPGFLLLTFGFLLALYALNQVQLWLFTSIKFWVVFGVGVILLVWLYFVERKKKEPYVCFDLLDNKNYNYNLIVRFVSQVIFTNTLFFFPIFSQNILGNTPLVAGLQLLYLAVICGLCSPVFGGFIEKMGHRLPSFVGSFCYLLATIVMYFYHFEHNYLLPAIVLFLIGLGTGILFVVTNSAMLVFAPEKLQSQSSGFFFTLALLDNSLGLAVAGFILAFRAKAMVFRQLENLHISLSNSKQLIVERVSTGIADIELLQSVGNLSKVLMRTATEAFTYGFRGVLLFWLILSVIGLIFSTLIRDKRVV